MVLLLIGSFREPLKWQVGLDDILCIRCQWQFREWGRDLLLWPGCPMWQFQCEPTKSCLLLWQTYAGQAAHNTLARCSSWSSRTRNGC